MTYDSTTQVQPIMLDGEELKIGDEVIVARQPESPVADALWLTSMVRLVGRCGVYYTPSTQLESDLRIYGEPVVGITIDGSLWWFRLSELDRVHTYHQAAHVQPQAQPEHDTPTEFPNLVHTNETTGPGLLHPACRNSAFPYNTDFLVNERRLAPYDDLHGTLSLRPGHDAYLTQVEFDRAQEDRRQRFAQWRDDREYRRNQFLCQIRNKLAAHPFGNTKKGVINFGRITDRTVRSYYINNFKQQNRDGRAAAKIIGRLVGHFNPNPATTNRSTLSEDEVFALLSSILTGIVPFPARDALEARNDQAGAAYRAYTAARRKLSHTGEWQQVPWNTQAWFGENDAANNRLPHISVEKPQEVAYYQSVDKLIRGIETRTKPGRFLAKFFPNLTPDQVRQYANDYLAATAPRQLHFARTQDEIITAIDEGPSESCQARRYHDKAPYDSPWYRGHLHPAAAYASGDFEVLYITDDNLPADLTRLRAETQRITARVVCNAKHKLAARIYGDNDKMRPLLVEAGYTQVARALVGCHLLQIENEAGSGYLMPYVDAGTRSGSGCLYVESDYDHEKGSVWVLTRENGHSTYAGYNNKGVLDDEEEHRCPRCGATHNDQEDIYYSGYEEVNYCSCCEDDFVNAVVRRGRYGEEQDAVLLHNAIEIDGDWYVNDDGRLLRWGFAQCIHCDEWTSLDDTTTTDSGLVCCEHWIVELAEESPDGNEYGYHPDCTQYVNTETGETVWLDDASDVDDFTREDDEGEEVPLYVSLDEWREMQDEREQREAKGAFEFVGPKPRMVQPAAPVYFDDALRV